MGSGLILGPAASPRPILVPPSWGPGLILAPILGFASRTLFLPKLMYPSRGYFGAYSYFGATSALVLVPSLGLSGHFAGPPFWSLRGLFWTPDAYNVRPPGAPGAYFGAGPILGPVWVVPGTYFGVSRGASPGLFWGLSVPILGPPAWGSPTYFGPAKGLSLCLPCLFWDPSFWGLPVPIWGPPGAS